MFFGNETRYRFWKDCHCLVELCKRLMDLYLLHEIDEDAKRVIHEDCLNAIRFYQDRICIQIEDVPIRDVVQMKDFFATLQATLKAVLRNSLRSKLVREFSSRVIQEIDSLLLKYPNF